jgi:6-phosphogluconolactonase
LPARDLRFAYVANADTQDISVFALRGDGTLVPVATVALQVPPHPGKSMLLAQSPDASCLYAAYFTAAGHSTVASLRIDRGTGMPELLGTTPLADSMSYLATDRTGRYLFSASYGGNKVAVNAIGTDGVVGRTLQVIVTPPKAHCIIADPSNRFVLHTSLGADLIHQAHFDAATGLLWPNHPPQLAVTPGSGPRFLVFAASGRFVYGICELDGSVDVFPYDSARGLLRPAVQRLSTLPAGFSGKVWAADIRLSPDGRFLYTSERSSSTLSGFRVDASDGRLEPLGSFVTVRQPRGIAIDPRGEFILAAGQLSNSIACWAIDAASGQLTPRDEEAVGRNPTWVEILCPHGGDQG